MKILLSMMTLLTILFLFSCKPKEDKAQHEEVQPIQQPVTDAGSHEAVVQEVIQGKSYTYLEVKEAGDIFWMAISKREIEPGETISFETPLEMKNFTSKELQRTFEPSILQAMFPLPHRPLSVSRLHQIRTKHLLSRKKRSRSNQLKAEYQLAKSFPREILMPIRPFELKGRLQKSIWRSWVETGYTFRMEPASPAVMICLSLHRIRSALAML